MIGSLPIEGKNFFCKAVLLSLLCHFSFFSLFVFSIHARSAGSKPLMVFLGSILRRHDVSYTSPDTVQEAGKMSATKSNAPLKTEQSKIVIPIVFSQKPYSSKIQEKTTKQTYKPPMEYAPLPAKQREKAASASRVDSSIPVYAPLKLEQK